MSTRLDNIQRNKDRIWTPEMRARVAASVSTAAKINPDSGETRYKKGSGSRGKKFSEEHRRKIGQARIGRPRPDFIQNIYKGPKTLAMRQKQSATWQAKSHEQVLLESQPGRDKIAEMYRLRKPTSLETAVMAILDSLGVKYEHNFKIGPYFVDIFIVSHNLVIECDGEYWHNLPGRAGIDKRRDTILSKMGYKIIRIPEIDIKSGCEPIITLALSG